MDIAALSMSLSQTKLQQSSSLAVMKMAMNTTKTNADGLTQMLSQTKNMEMSVQPHLGGTIDFKA